MEPFIATLISLLPVLIAASMAAVGSSTKKKIIRRTGIEPELIDGFMFVFFFENVDQLIISALLLVFI